MTGIGTTSVLETLIWGPPGLSLQVPAGVQALGMSTCKKIIQSQPKPSPIEGKSVSNET